MKSSSTRTGAVSAVLGLLCTTAAAQVDYSFNFQSTNNGFLGGLGFVDGPGLFGALSGDGHDAGPGDSIRICYGIDQTQGGSNADGLSDVTWLRVVAGIPDKDPIQDSNALSAPLLHFGLMSVSTASVDSLDGDACFSPLFTQGLDSVSGAPIQLDHRVHFVFHPSPIVVPPFPSFWDLYFQVLDDAPLLTPNVHGLEPDGIGAFREPLLSNLIFEIQGPLNTEFSFGYVGIYYLAATAEGLGLGSGGTGTGGVTNGNGRQGFGISGVTADSSDAVAHHRVTALGTNGVLSGFFGVSPGGPGRTQWFGGLATETPALWAANDGATGGAGSDLSIGTTVSTLQWRLIDHLAGGQANPNEAAHVPSLAFNASAVLFSRTPAAGMLQTPMSWDTLGDTRLGQAGSVALGLQPTLRQGLQGVPANLDPLMLSMLGNQPNFTFGGPFTSSRGVSDQSPGALLDLPDGIGGEGQSFMPAPLPIAAAPNPALVGTKLGMAAFGLQVDFATGKAGITEFGTAMTLNLQD